MSARGFDPEHVGAPRAADLDGEDTGLVRCPSCDLVCEEGEIDDDGHCADCRLAGELTTEEELRP